ncbi:MAG: hypothetical protein JST31_16900 [Actinobacteria bacterium]|nr:hypothetical protein [Actinomycetota bacterium]
MSARDSVSKRPLLLAALAAAALALLMLAAGGAARAAAATCPTFKVLHNDRIGPASLPAGTYAVTTEDVGLGCSTASQLFARFLEDYDGSLPIPWKVVARGSGKAAFTRGGQAGFSVARVGGSEEGGANTLLGKLCPDTFTVNADAQVGPLLFPKGRYLVYLPTGTGITCNRAAVLFTRFLSGGSQLPFPWKLKNQTATFYKSSNPTRSAFRIEPFAGS